MIILRWLSALIGGAFALLLLLVRWLCPGLAAQMDEDDTGAPGGVP